MTAPEKIWIAGPASECGHYYPNATEAEGEHGGQAVEYTRSDLIAARPAPAIEPQGLGQNDTIDSFCLTLRRLVSDAYAERDRFSHIAATIRINALHNGATNAEVDAMLSGDVSFVNWIAAKVEALAARPALHPASPLGAVMEVPEVRALVEALTPFDAVSIEMFSRNYNASDIVLTVGPVSGTCLTFRDFLNVRAALAPFARKGE